MRSLTENRMGLEDFTVKSSTFEGRNFCDFAVFDPIREIFQSRSSAKFFEIYNLRKLMSTKFKNWPLAKVCLQRIFQIFLNVKLRSTRKLQQMFLVVTFLSTCLWIHEKEE